VQKELVDLYGFHLPAVANGSFEEGTGRWTFTGTPTPEQLPAGEAMPSRGRSFLRLQAAGAVSAHSAAIKASPRTTYTTSVRVRGSAGSFSVEFRRCSGKASKTRAAAAVRFAISREAWVTVPLRYTTPADACLLRIRISGSQILDLDDVH
jgi:hypothetical protein